MFDHQPHRVERLQPLADADEIAERLPFDEFHDDKVGRLGAAHFVDRHDVRVPQRLAHFGLFVESIALVLIVGEPLAEHLEGDDLARVAMRRSIDPCEGPGTDLIQHLVMAEEEARAVAADQPIHLVGREQLAAQQQLLELGASRLRASPAISR